MFISELVIHNGTKQTYYIYIGLFAMCLLCLSSCKSDDEPKQYRKVVATYIIAFSGDTNDFEGSIEVSNETKHSVLTSDSFEKKEKNYFHDNSFEKRYELKLEAIEMGQELKVLINCSAFCFLNTHKSMSISIYKLGPKTQYLKRMYSPLNHPQ